VGCVYPGSGIVSIIRAHNRGISPISGCSTTARSWPDPSLNNRWSGVVPRYFPIQLPSAATLGPRGCRTVGTRRGQNRRRYQPKPTCAKNGGRQKVVVSGRSTTARSWPDPNLNNPWPGVDPRYFPINSPVPQRLVPVVPDCGNPAGAKPLPVPAKTQSAPKKGVGKKWVGTGIPADVCDDGAGED
jgi:hypothetical protein